MTPEFLEDPCLFFMPKCFSRMQPLTRLPFQPPITTCVKIVYSAFHDSAQMPSPLKPIPEKILQHSFSPSLSQVCISLYPGNTPVESLTLLRIKASVWSLSSLGESESRHHISSGQQFLHTKSVED